MVFNAPTLQNRGQLSNLAVFEGLTASDNLASDNLAIPEFCTQFLLLTQRKKFDRGDSIWQFHRAIPQGKAADFAFLSGILVVFPP